SRAPGATHEVTGNLTLHGVTKPVTVPVKVKSDAGGVTLEGTFTLQREEVKMTYGKGQVNNDVTVKLTVKAAKGRPAPAERGRGGGGGERAGCFSGLFFCLEEEENPGGRCRPPARRIKDSSHAPARLPAAGPALRRRAPRRRGGPAAPAAARAAPRPR